MSIGEKGDKGDIGLPGQLGPPGIDGLSGNRGLKGVFLFWKNKKKCPIIKFKDCTICTTFK